MSAAISVLGVLVFLAFGMAQLVAGFQGIEDGLGVGWAYAALIAAIPFRLTIPITIGSFFGAMNVWGWHWALAALFAAPGLMFMVPAFGAAIMSWIKR